MQTQTVYKKHGAIYYKETPKVVQVVDLYKREVSRMKTTEFLKTYLDFRCVEKISEHEYLEALLMCAERGRQKGRVVDIAIEPSPNIK